MPGSAIEFRETVRAFSDELVYAARDVRLPVGVRYPPVERLPAATETARSVGTDVRARGV
jgi:hypothetical protein